MSLFFFPAGTFMKISIWILTKDGVLYLHDDSVPVHSRFEISMESDKYIDAQKESFQDIDSEGRVDIILLV
jgi:hypothetical protein